MEIFGIKIGNEILLTNPLILQILLIIITLAVVKIAFGKEIIWGTRKTWEYFSYKDKSKQHDDWVADCIQRNGWIQKGDAESLDLEGRYLKKLTFILSPIGNPDNWRGGFILGNEKFQPQSIVDQNHAITIHAGSPPPIAQAQYIWIYNKAHGRNNPDSTTVTMLSKKQINFYIEINNKNYLTVYVNNQQVYSDRIPASFRKKVYLLAWGDHADCRIRFADIKTLLNW